MLARKRPGFTLIELLVVVTIISILAAILFPVLATARESARRTVCMTNVNQLVKAMNSYIQDNDEWYPPCCVRSERWEPGWRVMAPLVGPNRESVAYIDTWQGGWVRLVMPYVNNDKIFWCPNQTKLNGFEGASYYTSAQWLGHLSRVRFPSSKVLLQEGYSFHEPIIIRYCCAADRPPGANPDYRWQVRLMIGFVDGHVSHRLVASGNDVYKNYAGAYNPNFTTPADNPDFP